MAENTSASAQLARALKALQTARDGLEPTSRFKLLGVTRKMLDRAFENEAKTISELLGQHQTVHTDTKAESHTQQPTATPHPGPHDAVEPGFNDTLLAKTILSMQDVALVASHYRRSGLRIVFTNGCFDLLHRGHVKYLEEAKSLADVLIVGLNSDDSVQHLKGPLRPVLGLDDRLAIMSALKSVDHVVVFEGLTAEDLIAAVRPDLYVKGGDYRPEYPPPEARIAEQLGGSFRTLSYTENISTSKVIDTIKRRLQC